MFENELDRCKVCDNSACNELLKVNSSIILSCSNCGHRFFSKNAIDGFNLNEIYGDKYVGFRHDSSFQLRLDKEFKNRFKTRKGDFAKVLDIGCGNGDFLKVCKENGYDAIGIDVSKEAVEYCNSNGFNAFEFENYQKTEHSDFDFVTMWDVIEHLPEPKELVEFSYNQLSVNGYLVIKTPLHSKITFQIISVFKRLAKSILQYPAHIQFYTKKSIVHILESSGFEIDEIIYIRQMRTPRTKTGIKNFVKKLFKKIIRLITRDTNIYIFAIKKAGDN